MTMRRVSQGRTKIIGRFALCTFSPHTKAFRALMLTALPNHAEERFQRVRRALSYVMVPSLHVPRLAQTRHCRDRALVMIVP